MPVTMPGSAIGSTMSRFTASLPRNENRSSAIAQTVPSTSAIAVARTATSTEVPTADQAPAFVAARPHHSSVSESGGHENAWLVLNELTSTMQSGA